MVRRRCSGLFLEVTQLLVLVYMILKSNMFSLLLIGAAAMLTSRSSPGIEWRRVPSFTRRLLKL